MNLQSIIPLVVYKLSTASLETTDGFKMRLQVARLDWVSRPKLLELIASLGHSLHGLVESQS